MNRPSFFPADSSFTPEDVRARWADSELANRVGPPMLLAGRLLTRRIEHALAAAGLGLTPAQARTLVMLHIHGPSSQQALSVCTDVEPSTIVKTLDVLEREGLAVRDKNPDDRRAYRVRLTAAGQELIPRLFRLWDEIDAELFEILDPSERAALQLYLGRVIARLWSTGMLCGEPDGGRPGEAEKATARHEGGPP